MEDPSSPRQHDGERSYRQNLGTYAGAGVARSRGARTSTGYDAAQTEPGPDEGAVRSCHETNIPYS